MAKIKGLSTEPYKGVRDFYPEDMALFNYIVNTMREVCERFGYQEYSASVLEPAELYEAKTGDEIVQEQTYTFEDRGGRRVTLRPEMTPSVARLVAGKRRELSFPLRWYSIPNLYRYERPQRGRLREHWQLNADIFGSDRLDADIEIITLAAEIMKAFGAERAHYEIKINSRAFLTNHFKRAGLSAEKTKEMIRLLDRKNKIDTFDTEARAILGKPFEEPDPRKDPLIEGALTTLKTRGITNAQADYSIARGLDYYTGIVFEVFDTSPKNRRSMFGGGRYNNLTEIFGGESIPAVGFGMGDVTMRDFLETRHLIPAYAPATDLYLCTLSDAHIEAAQMLAGTLRARGLNVAVNISDKKVGDQIKKAHKENIPFILCVGENEIASKSYKVKYLRSGEEREVAEEDLADYIWSHEV